MKIKIAYFTRPTWYSRIAYHYLKSNFEKVILVSDELDKKKKFPNCDLIISFGYQKIIPNNILKKSKYAINFHPSTLSNPGAGSYSYPIYKDEKYHGVVCHQMTAKPDQGKILFEKKFRINKNYDFLSLRDKTLVKSLELFYKVVDKIINEKKIKFKFSKKKWKRKPRIFTEYRDEILTINNKTDILKKIKSINPYMPGPYSKNKKILTETRKIKKYYKYTY